MKRIGVAAGSYDPIHLGHIDVIRRASKLVDELHVVVANDAAKKYMHSGNERMVMVAKACDDYNVVVHLVEREQTLVSWVKSNFDVEQDSVVLFRGVRNSVDLAHEQALAHTNQMLCPDISTVVLLTDPKLAHISSTIVRTLYQYEDTKHLLPQYVPSWIIKD